jgi:hypothetical protein
VIENDAQRRVLVHLMVPRTVSKLRQLLNEDHAQGVRILEGGSLRELDIRRTLGDLVALGCVKEFSGEDPLTMVKEMDDDPEVMAHPMPEPEEFGKWDDKKNDYSTKVRHRAQAWADTFYDDEGQLTDRFQPDATYYIMTQDALDWFQTPGPDVPPEHEGLQPGPVMLGS